MNRFRAQTPAFVAITITGLIAILIADVMTTLTTAQDAKAPPLVVRVALFSSDQGRLDDYQGFIEGHLFPALRAVPGYVGTFLGRDATTGQLISLSFWRGEADAVAGEEAVGRAIRALPAGSAPRPSNVAKYAVEYRDIKETLAK